MVSIFYNGLYILFFIFLSVFSLLGQQTTISKISSKDEVFQNSITRLLFDSNGNLFVNTNSGLYIFDGQKNQALGHIDLTARLNGIIRDSNENIYVVDENKNIYLKDNNHHRLKRLTRTNADIINWLKPKYSLKQKNQTEQYFGKLFNLLTNLEYKDVYDLTNQGISYHVNANIVHDFIKQYFMVDKGLIEVTADNKFYLFRDTLDKIIIESEAHPDMFRKGFTFYTKDQTFVLYNQKIYRLRIEENILKKEEILSGVALDKRENNIMSGEYDAKNNTFYFGTNYEGIYQIKKTFFTVQKLNLNDTNARIFKSNNVFYSQMKSDFKSNNVFYSQVELDCNTILCDNTLLSKDSKSKIFNEGFKNIRERYTNFKDDKKQIWHFNDNHIIVQKDQTKKIIKFDFSGKSILSISQISENKYVLLSYNSLFVLENYKIVKEHKFTNLELAEMCIFVYLFPKENNIHILTNKQIFKLNLNDLKTNTITSLKKAEYRIVSPLNSELYFIGTYGNGFLLYDGKKWTPMPLDKKGHLKFAHVALCDANGHVWISTNKGLFRARLQDMIDYTHGKIKDVFYYYYDKSSGFLTDEFNGGCQSPAIKLRDGRFSFSSMDGLVQFDPLKVPALFPNNPLQLIHLSLNGQPQDSIPPHLEISQDIKDIKLEVSTAYYGHPDNLVIQYKISGYVDAWTDVTDQSYITIQNATHGSFNIEIRKRRGFGKDEFEYISYPVKVLPYFYQTLWFKALLILTLSGFVYLISLLYSRYLIRQNKELESIIKERNQEVLQTNEVLQEQVKQNDLFQSIFVHDIKSPIRFIASNAALLKTHWSSLNTQIKQDQISHIHDSAIKIDHFIEETLLWIKIRNGELQANINTFQVLPLIQESIDFYKASDKIIRGDIQILADVCQDLYLNQDERLFATIVRNLISNSIKYTAQGKITVYFLSNPNGSFTIGCKDTGKGMAKSLVEKLLSDHYRGNDIRDDSFKMGYVIIKEIVRLISGQLHIESEENHGTHVWVEI